MNYHVDSGNQNNKECYSYEFYNIDDAIRKLQNIKKKNKDAVIIMCKIDFDNNEEMKIVTTPDEGCAIIEESGSIILNEDKYISHLQVFSVHQKSLKEIVKRGILYDIFI